MRNPLQQKISLVLSTSLLSLTLAGAIIQQAHAVPTASPGDNSKLEVKLNALTGSSLTTMVVGLAPFWFVSVPAEIASFGTEMGVINTPARFNPPGNKSVHTSDDGDNDLCYFDLGIVAGKEADISRFYFLRTDRLEEDDETTAFGNLGNPNVYHPHGSVRVSADNPNTLAEGVHTINWEAETRVNSLIDIALPTALLASTIYSEKKTQERVISKQIDTILKKLKDAGKDATPFAVQNAKKLARIKILRGKVLDSWKGLIQSFGIGQANINALDKLDFTSARNLASQQITVWDEHAPYYQDANTTSTVEQQDISLEATDFGGVRLGRVVGSLRNKFVVTDDCNRPITLSIQDDDATLMKIGEVTPITWQLQDAGPYPSTLPLAANQQLVNGKVITTLTQNVTVADTQPPLLLPPDGFARESSTAIDLTSSDFPLGRPKVVDLADPRPTFSNTQPDTLQPDHRYAIVWQAQDASGNVTVAPQDNPDQYTQYVTIKTPGTNTAPTAASTSAATTTATAVEIALSGNDNDILDGRADPLSFKIQDYPPNGQFEAPLLPFFIEDFRLSPVGDNETIEDNEIVRTSPLGSLADQFRLEDEAGRSDLLSGNYCEASQPIPANFVYKPSYVHVDDDDYYYVRDSFWTCDNGASSPLPRISKWDANGEMVGMQDLSSLMSSTTSLDEDFSVDKLGWIWFATVDRDSNDDITETRLYGMNRNLAYFDQYGSLTTNAQLLGAEDKFQDMVVNTDDEVFYELRGFGFRVSKLDENYQTNRALELAGYLNGAETPPTETQDVGGATRSLSSAVTAYNVPMTQREGFTSLPGQCLRQPYVLFTYKYLNYNQYVYRMRSNCPLATDIEVDSEGYIYIAQRDLHRILKYEPAYRDDNGDWQVGDFVGWMGDCIANRQNAQGVYYNGCDEELGISRGYQCSDEKCEQANSTPSRAYDDILFTAFTGASQPGAFNMPASMKMGPGDILYVADTGNSRVQRFGADGAFAGEARSTGTGINQGDDGGFMLGNFGKPYALSVNSSAFFVINRDDDNGDNFLHVFKTLPFYDVTDNSAKIKYVSDFNFQGSDAFSYIVDDGIAQSTPATVSLSISRAFRPPEDLSVQCYGNFTSINALTTEIPCRFDEDSVIYLHVTSKDPDGFISTGDGGLDQHSFSVTVDPTHGQLTQLATTDNGALYAYTPTKDYNGSDSFAFNAFDGVDHAADDVVAEVTIDPVPDPVDIDLDSNIKAARGFNRMISVPFSDVDENYQPELLYIQWGDGSQTIPDTWVNSGRFDENGVELTPQVDFAPDSAAVSETGGRPGTGLGMLIGSHNYADAGNHPLELRMMNHDNAGEPNLQTLASSNIEVVEATVVTAVMNEPTDPVDPETAFDLSFIVTNEIPEFWSGLIARNATASVEIPDGMNVLSMDAFCSSGATIQCNLGDLAVGESKQVTLHVQISLDAALESTEMALDITLDDAGPHYQDRNVSTVNISLKDADEDAVVDVADAFPNDERYSQDSDDDRIADAWELANGLDPNNASDATQDPDGDGASNLREFQQETSPMLAEATAPPEQFNLGGSDDDRLGHRVAAGDINGDGYSDVVAGAPGYQGQGAIVIYYGAADGSNALAPLTIAGTTNLGKAVAVGELNGDKYADIAVSSDQGVYLLMGSASSLGSPILLPPTQVESTLFGQALLITDLDNDKLPDLLISDPGLALGPELSVTTGAVNLYRASSQYWQAASPQRDRLIMLGFRSQGGTTIGEYRLGDSLAAGDIDGDGLTDLMVGAAFADPVSNNTVYRAGVVAGYLGSNMDFSATGYLLHDFTLYGETPGDRFGYSLSSGQDLDGDGHDDLVVGAYANNGMGAAYVYQGATQDWWSVSTPDPVKLQGAAAGDQFGVSLALTPPTAYSHQAGIIVGSNRAKRDTDPDEGRVDFYSDLIVADPWLTLYGDTRDMLGYAVASAGDINNDGEADYVIGAPDISNGGYIGDGGYIRLYSARSGAQQSDADGDLVADALDNCVDVANTDQFDEDSDGQGNACDPAPRGGDTSGTGDSSSSGGGGAVEPLSMLLLLILLGFTQLTAGGLCLRKAVGTSGRKAGSKFN